MDREDDEKRGAAGGGFEQGMRSALEKAPGMAVPSWLTMQSAMAGGAAGGAAAASWRWIIGPAAGAALIGGALWLSDPAPNEPEADASTETVQPEGAGPGAVEPLEWFEDDATAAHEVWRIEKDAVSIEVTEVVGDLEQSSPQLRLEEDRSVSEKDLGADGGHNAPAPSSKEAPATGLAKDEKPEDWADLPVEKLAAFGVDITDACVGTEIGFRMAKPRDNVRVLWNFGDGQFSNVPSPQHVFKAPGTYDITLSVTRVSDGLIRTRTIENLVTIHANPEADFTWEVPGSSMRSPSVTMLNASENAASCTWVVDGEITQAGKTAVFDLERVGEHVVQLVASSSHGCQSVASHTIEVGNRFGIGGSGRFSPNGDGRYDTFMPRGLASLELPFVFSIEDGDGRIVFETGSVAAWDGQLPDGTAARSGQLYSWTVVVQEKEGPSYFSDEVLVE
jgi:hypothetical protein